MPLTPVPEMSGFACGAGNTSSLFSFISRYSHKYAQSISSESEKNPVGRGGRPLVACDILYNPGSSVQRMNEKSQIGEKSDGLLFLWVVTDKAG